ncbi:MAG: hypothetical protein LBQ55_06315, partial [Treponema sp.]|nr:hypothetical protein [Treponema sp.]
PQAGPRTMRGTLRHQRRQTCPFKGRTASVKKSQAKACVNKSDDRLAPRKGYAATLRVGRLSWTVVS